MIEQKHSLRSLADASGIEPRTIRSWIQQELLPRPLSAGRDAQYPADTLARLLAIKTLKELYGMPLSAIRQELLSAVPEKIAEYAAQAANAPGSSGLTLPSSDDMIAPSAPANSHGPTQSTAADYLRALRAHGVFGGSAKALSEPAAERSVVVDPIELRANEITVLAEQSFNALRDSSGDSMAARTEQSAIGKAVALLEQVAGTRAPRRAKGDVVLSIPVTRDVRLSVRGDMTPQDIAYYERIADLLREILMGGSRHD